MPVASLRNISKDVLSIPVSHRRYLSRPSWFLWLTGLKEISKQIARVSVLAYILCFLKDVICIVSKILSFFQLVLLRGQTEHLELDDSPSECCVKSWSTYGVCRKITTRISEPLWKYLNYFSFCKSFWLHSSCQDLNTPTHFKAVFVVTHLAMFVIFHPSP